MEDKTIMEFLRFLIHTKLSQEYSYIFKTLTIYISLVNIEGKRKLTEAMKMFIIDNKQILSKLKTTFGLVSDDKNIELDDVVINKLSSICYVK